MKRVGHWLGSKSAKNSSSQSLTSLDERQYLEDALRAANHIMQDDVDAAEEGLSKGNSAFHKLGKGVVTFLKATLGFEGEVMREASERLAEAEHTASEQLRHSQRAHHLYHSSIYPAGSEYALCQAESQLMSAVVGVLNENLTESIKGFYKIRKAYITLDGIIEAERKFVRGRSSTSVRGSMENSFYSQKQGRGLPGGFNDSTESFASSGPPVSKTYAEQSARDDAEDDDDKFYDADEGDEGVLPAQYTGRTESNGIQNRMGNLSLDTEGRTANGYASNPNIQSPPTLPKSNDSQHIHALEEGPDSEIFSNPIDVFIHSGSNLCYGIMLLMISLIPPAFSKLLSIIGFRGDRDRGTRLLWQASRFNNINGAMAGLVILGYYNGLIGFCDIVPESGEGSYPKERCRALLVEMRARYPRSHLWILEDARMVAGDRRLEEAVELLSANKKSTLKQVEALQWFEHSLNCMYLHSYQACADSFIKCVQLNNWSHGLYYYIAGACHVELYRQHRSSNPSLARTHATAATDLLLKVPLNTGKKRFMARQLPFDTFVSRKIQKWQSRAKERRCELIDAVGISPVEEMIYFWNGYKRMRREQMEDSLQRLRWSEMQPAWKEEGLDERAILAVLRAATYRNLDRIEEARDVLTEEVLGHEWSEFKGGVRDNWTMPVAGYEMGVCAWQEWRGLSGVQKEGDVGRELLGECARWLGKVARWEGFDLDARVGIKVSTGRETLRKMGVGAV